MATLCPSCGTENSATAKICEKCGTRFMPAWKMALQILVLMGTPILIIFIVKFVIDNMIH
jgi:uncharacterized membrane protein YvbJ